jgi:hypothetical protein
MKLPVFFASIVEPRSKHSHSKSLIRTVFNEVLLNDLLDVLKKLAQFA